MLSAVAAQPIALYPGDTNLDSVCNVRDLLPVGVAHGRFAGERLIPGVDWSEKLAEGIPGNQLPTTAINLVHADANGDGWVDSLDIEIIALNYGQVVPGADPLPPAYQPAVPALVSYCPAIRLVFDRDTAEVRTQFSLRIILEMPPDGVPEPEGILGLSFSLNYAVDFIRDSFTRVIPNLEGNDLMWVWATFRQADFARQLPPTGSIDLAAAGKGRNALRQTRELAQVHFIVEDMLLRSPVEQLFWVDIDPASILILNREEQRLFDVCALAPDTILLFDPVTSLSSLPPEPAPGLQLWPNPVQNGQPLQVQSHEPLRELRLLSLDGRVAARWSRPATGYTELRLPPLPAGHYIMAGQTAKGWLYQKLTLTSHIP